MLILRPIEPTDLDDLARLADLLDSMNLPSDRAFLTARIERSQATFARVSALGDDARDPNETGISMFVLEDTSTGRCVGSKKALSSVLGSSPRAKYPMNVEDLRNQKICRKS